MAGIEVRLRSSTAEWEPAALRAMQQASPLALHCALTAIRQARRFKSAWDALTNEYRFVRRAVAQGDFTEGIRAAVIDKDRKQHWLQADRSVSQADADAMFADLGNHELSASESFSRRSKPNRRDS